MTRASFAGTDLSSLFASIGKEAAAASKSTTGASGGAAVINPVQTYSAPKSSAEQAAEDNDMYDQWANGLISDDEWLAYIAKRVSQTTGNAKEHEKWVKYQRKYQTSISDNKMQYAYDQGDITADEFIAYQRKVLAGMDSDSQEWRERNSALTKMIEEREQSDIVLRAQNMSADIANGKATQDDLIKLYQEGLAKAKPGSTWFDKLTGALAQAKSDKAAAEFNGGAEEIQYLFEAGKISGNEAGKRLRALAETHLKGDKQNYYKTLQSALGYEKYGTGTGTSGGRGGGGGGRGGSGKTSLPTLADTYLESAWKAAKKFIAVANTPGEGPSYISNTAGKALMEIDRATAFLVQHPYRGSKTARTDLEKIRKDILASAKSSNTLSAQDKLRATVMTHSGAINAAIHDGAADGGASVIKAISALNADLAPLVNSLGVDQYGNMTGAPGISPYVGKPGIPQKPNEWQVADASKMSEAFALYNWTNNILMAANSEQGLTDEDVARLTKDGQALWLTGEKKKYSAEPEFAISGGTIVPISWDLIAKSAAESAQDLPGIRNGTRVPVRYADGTATVVSRVEVAGPHVIDGGMSAATSISQLDSKKLGLAPDNILVPVLEKNEDGTISVVMTEATPYSVDASSVQANVSVTLDGKTYKKGEFIPSDVWMKRDSKTQSGLVSAGQVTILDRAPVEGWYEYSTADGSVYAFNRTDGSTVRTGSRGQPNYVPFKVINGAIGEYVNGVVPADSITTNPMLTSVPMGLGDNVTSDEAAKFIATNPSLKGATPIIGADGKSDYIDHTDPFLSTRYGDDRPGERAYLDGSPQRVGSGAAISPINQRGQGDLTGLSARFGIRGLSGTPGRNFASQPWNAEAPEIAWTATTTGYPGIPTTEMLPGLVGAKYTHTGPRITGRAPSTAPKVGAAPIVNASTGFDMRTEANAQTGFSLPARQPGALPTGGTAKISVPVGAQPSRRHDAPPPAAPAVRLPKPAKKKKTTASGGAVGSTKVAS